MRAPLPLGDLDSTRWFSSKLLYPLVWMAEKCTNTVCAAIVLTDQAIPLSALNHFAVPVAIGPSPFIRCHGAI